MGAGWRPTTSGDWLDILRNASAALESDPEDAEAQQIVEEARGNLTPRVLEAFDRERPGRLRDLREAQPGKLATAVEEYGRAGSFGLQDELAGGVSALGHALPGGESPGQAYLRSRDEQRAYQDAARAHNPGTAFAGNVAGTIVNPLTAVTASLPVVRGAVQPGVGAAMRALRAMLAGGAVGAGEGAVRSVGESEASGTGMLRDVPRDAAIGFGLGAAGTGLGVTLGRRNAARELQEQTIVDRAKVAKEQAARAPAQTRSARTAARSAARRERFARENEPLQQTIMDARAARAGQASEGTVARPAQGRLRATNEERPILPDPNPPERPLPVARATPEEVDAPRLPPEEAPEMVRGTEYPPKPRDPVAEAHAARPRDVPPAPRPPHSGRGPRGGATYSTNSPDHGLPTPGPLAQVLALPREQMTGMLRGLTRAEAKNAMAQVKLAQSLGQLDDETASAALAALKRGKR